jgi:hypothetical protein
VERFVAAGEPKVDMLFPNKKGSVNNGAFSKKTYWLMKASFFYYLMPTDNQQ